MAHLGTLLAARLAAAPLAVCPVRGATILQALLLDVELAPEIEGDRWEEAADRLARSGVVQIHGLLVHRGTGRGWLDRYLGLTTYGDVVRRLGLALSGRAPEVVLDVDSPGGEVQGMFDAADAIRDAGKPTRAVVNENALSAAYALASAADRVELPRTGAVGSVGVYSLHRDISGRLAQWGERVEFVHAGERKVDGNPYQPLSARARADMQAEVDRAYAMFVDHVAKARGMTPEAVRATEARTYEGELAVEAGLADAVVSGTLRVARPEPETPALSLPWPVGRARGFIRPASPFARSVPA